MYTLKSHENMHLSTVGSCMRCLGRCWLVLYFFPHLGYCVPKSFNHRRALINEPRYLACLKHYGIYLLMSRIGNIRWLGWRRTVTANSGPIGNNCGSKSNRTGWNSSAFTGLQKDRNSTGFIIHLKIKATRIR